MKRPTQEIITQEIERLKEVKPRLPFRNFFGESVHDAVEAQIRVLDRMMSEDAIYSRYEPDEDEDPEGSRNELDAALDARRWLDGEEESPSSGWAELVK